MTHYEIDILAHECNDKSIAIGERKFLRLRPHKGEPYRFDTERDAEKCVEMCYPDACVERRLGGENFYRIVKVEGE